MSQTNVTSPSIPTTERASWLRRPFKIIRGNLRVYLLANALTYGILLLGFGAGLLFPELNQTQRTSLEEDGTGDLVRALLSTPWLFALTIFVVNVFRLSALMVVLPSLVVPFAGLAIFAYWTFTTGIVLVPDSDIGWVALIPHALTVVIEFQAYVLIALGVFLLGKFWLWPRTIGAENRRRGYLRGLQHLGWLSLPALVLLVIGAIYEAFSLAYFVGPLANWLL